MFILNLQCGFVFVTSVLLWLGFLVCFFYERIYLLLLDRKLIKQKREIFLNRKKYEWFWNLFLFSFSVKYVKKTCSSEVDMEHEKLLECTSI